MKCFLVLSVLLPGALASASALAAPCEQAPGTTKVYLQIGDTQEPLIKALARKLRDNTPNPITIIYATSGSCTNVDAILRDTPFAGNMGYVPSVAEDPAWTVAMPPITCTPDAPGRVPDIANSNVFVSACNLTVPASIAEVHGPTQAYVMAVPEANTADRAITFEEAYFAFGFGSAGGAQPWTEENQLFIRTVTKSTLLSWAASIGVPASKWKGVRLDKSSEVVNSLATSAAPSRAIGILGSEVYDANRGKLNALAFKARGQSYAYFPDSTATATDKKNVRDGHYTVWSPTIYLAKGSAGQPSNPAAAYIINLIAGRSVTPGPVFDPVALIVAAGIVPDCAMRVTRDFEGGKLRLYQPSESCTCRFEKLATGTSTCQTCTDTCSSGTCRAGLCEER
ncbi:MAG: hypothetical protein HC863_02985 [Myxococcales bacterium]|nr:hypothetical protein [Myxococcales bacterium]